MKINLIFVFVKILQCKCVVCIVSLSLWVYKFDLSNLGLSTTLNCVGKKLNNGLSIDSTTKLITI